MFRKIAAVPNLQPLASDDIWRVALEGETVIRVVRFHTEMGGVKWDLLAMGDMTDEQLDAYEAAVSGIHEGHPGASSALGV